MAVGADIALGHIDSDELDIGVLVSSPCQRSTVQVANADDDVSAVVDSLTDHGLTVLIGSVSLGDVVLAVIAHVAGNSSPASLVEALIIDRAGIAGQSDLDDLLSAALSAGSGGRAAAAEEAVLVEEAEEPPQAVRAAAAAAAPATARKLRREIFIRNSPFILKNCVKE